MSPCVSAAARAAGFGVGSAAAARSASTSASSSSGSTRTPASGGTNSGGPPTRVATTERPQASASSAACPKGSTSEGWHRTSAAASSSGIRSCSTLPRTLDARPAFELASQRPVAGERERSLAEPLERPCEPRDVLALAEGADAEEGGRFALGARLRPETLEVDAAVDHLGLPACFGNPLLEQPPQVVRDGDHGLRAADDEARRRADPGHPADVRDVLAVRGHDERCPAEQRAPEPGRDEEVRVDDVGPEAASGAGRGDGEAKVAERPACARVEHDALELVPEGDELGFQVADEDAEVRLGGARVHLGDEQDPHAATLPDRSARVLDRPAVL